MDRDHTDWLDERLFRPGKNDGGIVLLSPRIMREARRFQCMSLGDTLESARLLAECAMEILNQRRQRTGLHSPSQVRPRRA